MTDREATGVVDFFNDTGGYGFIETEHSDEDVFFHMEDIDGPDLTEGTAVAFDIEQAPKGPRATNVLRDPASGSNGGSTTGLVGRLRSSLHSDDQSGGNAGRDANEDGETPADHERRPERNGNGNGNRYDAVGEVGFFNDTGGYGFIETEHSDEDVFFHMEDIDGPDLTEGTAVAFDIEQAPKGPRATNVLRDPASDPGVPARRSTASGPRGGSEAEDGDTVVYRGDEGDRSNDTEVYTGNESTEPTDTEVYSSTETGTEEGRCLRCGTTVSEYGDVNFCPNCGSDLSSGE